VSDTNTNSYEESAKVLTANTPSLGLTTLTVAYAPPSGPPQSVGVVLTGAATLAPGPVSLALSGAITGSSILRA
jgi:hypothetical protein